MNTATKSTHTPGPWMVSEYARTDTGEIKVGVSTKRTPGSLDGDSRSIAFTTGGAYCIPGDEWYKPEVVAENRANARLMSAAPCLLSALRQLVSDVEYLIVDGTLPESANDHDAMNAARAAIAKATA